RGVRRLRRRDRRRRARVPRPDARARLIRPGMGGARRARAGGDGSHLAGVRRRVVDELSPRAPSRCELAWARLGSLFGAFGVGFQEARVVRGPAARGLIGALASAFAVGQIVALVGVSYVLRAGGGLSGALLTAGALLAASSVALWPGSQGEPA